MKKYALMVIFAIFCMSLFSGASLLTNAYKSHLPSSVVETNSDLTASADTTTITTGNELNLAIKNQSGSITTNTVITKIVFDYTANMSRYSLTGATTTALSINGVSATMYRSSSGTEVYIFSSSNIKAPADSSYTFSTFLKLTTITLNNYHASSGTVDMNHLFSGCTAITSIDLSKVNTSAVTNMSYMFYNCQKLTSVNLSGSFTTINVTNMSSMFSTCGALTAIDFSNFNTKKVTNMSRMFYSCDDLTELNFSTFNTSYVTNMSYMFYTCDSLSSLNLSSFDTSNVTDMSYMFYCTFNLTSLDLSSFNTIKVTNMTYMFYGCDATSLDLSNFDTSNVTNMAHMFRNCKASTINVSSFNTSKVTSMVSMFDTCKYLTTIDVSSFDTSNVRSMERMFTYCSGLTGLDLTSFHTDSVTSMRSMFSWAENLTYILMPNFNTKSVTTMFYMFTYCSSLKLLDLRAFNTSKVTNTVDMFCNCTALRSIYVTRYNSITGLGWTVDNVTSTNSYEMFTDCTSLVGKNGTTYSASYTDKTYGRIDDAGAPGYLTEGNPVFMVSFDKQGGSGGTSTISVTYGNSMPTITRPTKAGNIFNGYYSEASGGGYQYYTLTGTSARVCDFATDTTLYADWVAETYSIIFDANGGSVSPARLDNASYGSTITLPTPTKEGNYFAGWKYGTSTYAAGSFVVPDLGNNGASVTFVAQWTPEKYQVTFNANGGTSVAAQTYTFGSIYTMPTSTKAGNSLSGWYCANTDSTYKGTITMPDLTPGVASSTTASVTFVAQWEANTYYVRFNANGGSGTMADLEMKYGQAKNLTANAFTRAGWIFLGWSRTSSPASPEYTNMQSVINLSSTADDIVILYAIWGDTWANHTTAPSKNVSGVYIIDSAEKLAWMSGYCLKTGSLSGYFIQTANINLSAYLWVPIGNSSRYFMGSYDGQGYAITNIKINQIVGVASEYQGLFGIVRGTSSAYATLKNIRLMSGEIYGTSYTGGIVGDISYANVTDCTNAASIAGVEGAGGVIGTAALTNIAGCYNYGNVTAEGIMGGIVAFGRGSAHLTNCYSSGTISGSAYVGGLYGYASLRVDVASCAFEGTIACNGGYYGAVAGYMATGSNITDCYISANVPSTTNYYGLCSTNATISNCVFEINNAKRFKGTDFSHFTMTANSKPLPWGLTWLFMGGTPITSTTQLTSAGYTKVN